MIVRKINLKIVFLNRNINVNDLNSRKFDVQNTTMIDRNSM